MVGTASAGMVRGAVLGYVVSSVLRENLTDGEVLATSRGAMTSSEDFRTNLTGEDVTAACDRASSRVSPSPLWDDSVAGPEDDYDGMPIKLVSVQSVDVPEFGLLARPGLGSRRRRWSP